MSSTEIGTHTQRNTIELGNATLKQLMEIAEVFSEIPVGGEIQESTPEWNGKRVVWFAIYHEPDLSYEFNITMMGLLEDGRFIVGNDSGCSCPSPFAEGKDYYEAQPLSKAMTFEHINYLPVDWLSQLKGPVKSIHRVACQPETVSHRDIIIEDDEEIRSWMLGVYGLEKFVQDSKAKIRAEDEKVGRILIIEASGSPIVFLEVKDTTSGDPFLLRLPPHIVDKRWHSASGSVVLDAKAWTFGLMGTDLLEIVES